MTWLQVGLPVYVYSQGVEGCWTTQQLYLEVYFDRQHNKVVTNMGTEARILGSPTS